MSCIQEELHVPLYAVELWHEAARYWTMGTADPAWRVRELAIRLANLRASIKDGSLCDSDAIVAEALIIDNALSSVFEEPSKPWQFETKYIDTYPKLVYRCVYHVYTNDLISQTWNSIRLCRILLNEIILTRLSNPLKTSTTRDQAQYHTSMETLKQMTADILASVPQNIGYVSMLEAQQNPTNTPNKILASTRMPRQDPDAAAPLHIRFSHPSSIGSLPSSASKHELPIMRGTSGCLLIWHLYHVGTIVTTTVEARQWITDFLRFEARATGIA